MIKVRAPGKLILSGEHAVAQGAPALVIAVQDYVETRLTPADQFQFNLVALNDYTVCTKAELKQLQQDIECRYAAFQRSELSIRSVLQHPRQLIQYAVARLLTSLQLELSGLAIHMQSTIPIASGMGSSAASIVSLYTALTQGFCADSNGFDLATLKAIESLQHGRSSGVDLQVCALGGCHYFHQDQSTLRTLPHFPLHFVNTGARGDLSGFSITKAAQACQNTAVLMEFSIVTELMDQAIQRDDFAQFCEALRKNHALLNRIGVVPAKVAAFIELLNQHGFAAKISGAGAAAGDQAGIVLIAGEGDPTAICRDYGYETLQVKGDEHGVRTV